MLLILMSVLFFLMAALFAWAMLPDASERAIRQRIFSEVAAERRPSLLERLTVLLAPFNRYLPLEVYSVKTQRRLDTAAIRLHPLQFFVLQEICALAGAVLYFVLFGRGSLNLGWMLLFIAIGFLVPNLWVSNVQKNRQMAIARDLPSVVDLLNLSVGAGSDFISALARIVREFRPCPIREELGIVLQEIRMGKRRRDALRAFADRLRTAEVRTFSRTLIQVDRMGKGLTEALEVLAEDMHMTRFNWAERYAQQAPVKMLLPLILSLGAALLIVAGPILMQFLRGGFMSGGLQPH